MITFLLENVNVALILLFLVAVTSISAGAALHQLKGWGRTVIEVQSWLGVVCAIGFTVYWAYAWIALVGQTHDAVVLRHVLQLMGGATYIFATSLFGALLMSIVLYLRSKRVRGAVSSHEYSNGN